MYYLALQNTITKKISVYKLEDFGSNTVYHKFKIQTDEPDGEYLYMLFEYDDAGIEINHKDFITEDTDTGKRILITSLDGEDLILQDDSQIHTDNGIRIPALATGLLKITYNGN